MLEVARVPNISPLVLPMDNNLLQQCDVQELAIVPFRLCLAAVLLRFWAEHVFGHDR